MNKYIFGGNYFTVYFSRSAFDSSQLSNFFCFLYFLRFIVILHCVLFLIYFIISNIRVFSSIIQFISKWYTDINNSENIAL